MQNRLTALAVLMVLVAASWFVTKYVYKPWVKAPHCDKIKRDIDEFLVTRGSSRAPNDIAMLNNLYAQQTLDCGE